VWYIAHASTTVRLPRPKPFTASVLMRKDEIREKKEGGMKEGRKQRLSRGAPREWNVEGTRRKEGAALYTSAGGEAAVGALAAVNIYLLEQNFPSL
jgi:hypothetical protein